jgi:hypothetical protein
MERELIARRQMEIFKHLVPICNKRRSEEISADSFASNIFDDCPAALK